MTKLTHDCLQCGFGFSAVRIQNTLSLQMNQFIDKYYLREMLCGNLSSDWLS